jgi:hypothetical protein
LLIGPVPASADIKLFREIVILWNATEGVPYTIS